MTHLPKILIKELGITMGMNNLVVVKGKVWFLTILNIFVKNHNIYILNLKINGCLKNIIKKILLYFKEYDIFYNLCYTKNVLRKFSDALILLATWLSLLKF